MISRIVRIVDTRIANTTSLRVAFERLGAQTRLVDSAAGVRDAESLVLPGVGAFGAVMNRLERLGVREALRERIEAGRPTLCVCLGMQALALESEESPGVSGLGVLPVRVVRLREPPRRTHFGWSPLTTRGEGSVREGYAYFAHSYCVPEAPEGWIVTTASFGGRFVASMERGAVLACQFHPELSGAWGRGLLERWLGTHADTTSGEGACAWAR